MNDIRRGDRFAWVTGDDEPPGYIKFLGFDVESIGGGECRVKWTPTSVLLNSGGMVQGGFIAAALDLASGLASIEIGGDNLPSVSIKLDIEYFRPVKADGSMSYTVKGSVIHRSRHWVTCDGLILNSEGRLFARARHLMALGA